MFWYVYTQYIGFFGHKYTRYRGWQMGVDVVQGGFGCLGTQDVVFGHYDPHNI